MSNDTKIVIVGATSGIGLALTRLFVKKGCRVGIAARRTEELERLRNLALGRIEIQTLDVTQPNSVEHLQALIHRLGGMDIYIHSAGIGQMNVALNEEAELQTVEVNVDGFTRLVAFAFNYFSGVGRGEDIWLQSALLQAHEVWESQHLIRLPKPIKVLICRACDNLWLSEK